MADYDWIGGLDDRLPGIYVDMTEEGGPEKFFVPREMAKTSDSVKEFYRRSKSGEGLMAPLSHRAPVGAVQTLRERGLDPEFVGPRQGEDIAWLADKRRRRFVSDADPFASKMEASRRNQTEFQPEDANAIPAPEDMQPASRSLGRVRGLPVPERALEKTFSGRAVEPLVDTYTDPNAGAGSKAWATVMAPLQAVTPQLGQMGRIPGLALQLGAESHAADAAWARAESVKRQNELRRKLRLGPNDDVDDVKRQVGETDPRFGETQLEAQQAIDRTPGLVKAGRLAEVGGEVAGGLGEMLLGGEMAAINKIANVAPKGLNALGRMIKAAPPEATSLGKVGGAIQAARELIPAFTGAREAKVFQETGKAILESQQATGVRSLIPREIPAVAKDLWRESTTYQPSLEAAKNAFKSAAPYKDGLTGLGRELAQGARSVLTGATEAGLHKAVVTPYFAQGMARELWNQGPEAVEALASAPQTGDWEKAVREGIGTGATAAFMGGMARSAFHNRTPFDVDVPGGKFDTRTIDGQRALLETSALNWKRGEDGKWTSSDTPQSLSVKFMDKDSPEYKQATEGGDAIRGGGGAKEPIAWFNDAENTIYALRGETTPGIFQHEKLHWLVESGRLKGKLGDLEKGLGLKSGALADADTIQAVRADLESKMAGLPDGPEKSIHAEAVRQLNEALGATERIQENIERGEGLHPNYGYYKRLYDKNPAEFDKMFAAYEAGDTSAFKGDPMASQMYIALRQMETPEKYDQARRRQQQATVRRVLTGESSLTDKQKADATMRDIRLGRYDVAQKADVEAERTGVAQIALRNVQAAREEVAKAKEAFDQAPLEAAEKPNLAKALDEKMAAEQRALDAAKLMHTASKKSTTDAVAKLQEELTKAKADPAMGKNEKDVAVARIQQKIDRLKADPLADLLYPKKPTAPPAPKPQETAPAPKSAPKPAAKPAAEPAEVDADVEIEASDLDSFRGRDGELDYKAMEESFINELNLAPEQVASALKQAQAFEAKRKAAASAPAPPPAQAPPVEAQPPVEPPKSEPPKPAEVPKPPKQKPPKEAKTAAPPAEPAPNTVEAKAPAIPEPESLDVGTAKAVADKAAKTLSETWNKSGKGPAKAVKREMVNEAYRSHYRLLDVAEKEASANPADEGSKLAAEIARQRIEKIHVMADRWEVPRVERPIQEPPKTAPKEPAKEAPMEAVSDLSISEMKRGTEAPQEPVEAKTESTRPTEKELQEAIGEFDELYEKILDVSGMGSPDKINPRHVERLRDLLAKARKVVVADESVSKPADGGNLRVLDERRDKLNKLAESGKFGKASTGIRFSGREARNIDEIERESEIIRVVDHYAAQILKYREEGISETGARKVTVDETGRSKPAEIQPEISIDDLVRVVSNVEKIPEETARKWVQTYLTSGRSTRFGAATRSPSSDELERLSGTRYANQLGGMRFGEAPLGGESPVPIRTIPQKWAKIISGIRAQRIAPLQRESEIRKGNVSLGEKGEVDYEHPFEPFSPEQIVPLPEKKTRQSKPKSSYEDAEERVRIKDYYNTLRSAFEGELTERGVPKDLSPAEEAKATYEDLLGRSLFTVAGTATRMRRGTGVRFEDLVDAGNDAALRVVDKYIKQREAGVKGIESLGRTVNVAAQQAMTDAIYLSRGGGLAGKNAVRIGQIIDKEYDALRNDLDREPTTQEVVESLREKGNEGITEAVIKNHLKRQELQSSEISLDATARRGREGEDDTSYGELVADARVKPADEEIIRRSLEETQDKAFEALTKEERYIARKVGEKLLESPDAALPMAELVRDLGSSEHAIRRMYSSAVSKLGASLGKSDAERSRASLKRGIEGEVDSDIATKIVRMFPKAAAELDKPSMPDRVPLETVTEWLSEIPGLKADRIGWVIRRMREEGLLALGKDKGRIMVEVGAEGKTVWRKLDTVADVRAYGKEVSDVKEHAPKTSIPVWVKSLADARLTEAGHRAASRIARAVAERRAQKRDLLVRDVVSVRIPGSDEIPITRTADVTLQRIANEVIKAHGGAGRVADEGFDITDATIPSKVAASLPKGNVVDLIERGLLSPTYVPPGQDWDGAGFEYKGRKVHSLVLTDNGVAELPKAFRDAIYEGPKELPILREGLNELTRKGLVSITESGIVTTGKPSVVTLKTPAEPYVLPKKFDEGPGNLPKITPRPQAETDKWNPRGEAERLFNLIADVDRDVATKMAKDRYDSIVRLRQRYTARTALGHLVRDMGYEDRALMFQPAGIGYEGVIKRAKQEAAKLGIAAGDVIPREKLDSVGNFWEQTDPKSTNTGLLIVPGGDGKPSLIYYMDHGKLLGAWNTKFDPEAPVPVKSKDEVVASMLAKTEPGSIQRRVHAALAEHGVRRTPANEVFSEEGKRNVDLFTPDQMTMKLFRKWNENPEKLVGHVEYQIGDSRGGTQLTLDQIKKGLDDIIRKKNAYTPESFALHMLEMDRVRELYKKDPEGDDALADAGIDFIPEKGVEDAGKLGSNLQGAGDGRGVGPGSGEEILGGDQGLPGTKKNQYSGRQAGDPLGPELKEALDRLQQGVGIPKHVAAKLPATMRAALLDYTASVRSMEEASGHFEDKVEYTDANGQKRLHVLESPSLMADEMAGLSGKIMSGFLYGEQDSNGKWHGPVRGIKGDGDFDFRNDVEPFQALMKEAGPDYLKVALYRESKHALAVSQEKNASGEYIETGKDLKKAARIVDEIEGTGGKPPNEKILKLSRKFDAWYGAVLDYVVNSGAIPQELATTLRLKYPNYTSMQRVFDQIYSPGGASTRSVSSIGKRLQGSERETLDHTLAAIEYAHRMITLSERNRLYRTLGKAVDTNPVYWRNAVRRSRGSSGSPLSATGVKLKAAFELSKDKTGLSDDAIAQLDATLKDIIKAESEDKKAVKDRDFHKRSLSFGYWDGGQYNKFRIDEGIAKFLDEAVGSRHIGGQVARWASILSLARPLKWLTTHHWLFPIANQGRDVQTRAIQSEALGGVTGAMKMPFTPYYQLLRTVAASMGVRRGEDNAKRSLAYKMTAGSFANLTGEPTRIARQEYENMMRETDGTSKLMKGVLRIFHPLQLADAIVEPFESATRRAEFNLAKDRGLSDLEAGRAAREVTVNFSRHGSSEVLKSLGVISPFMHAGIASADKFYQTLKNHPISTMARGVLMLSVPAAINWVMTKDDEEIERKRKTPGGSLYMWTRLPDVDGMPEEYRGKIVAIPKGFVYGQIFMTGAEAALDEAYRRNPKSLAPMINAVRNLYGAKRQLDPERPGLETGTEIASRVGKSIGSQLLSFSSPPLVDLAAGLIAKKDLFFGTPIELESQKDLEPPDRQSPHTGELSKAISSTMWRTAQNLSDATNGAIDLEGFVPSSDQTAYIIDKMGSLAKSTRTAADEYVSTKVGKPMPPSEYSQLFGRFMPPEPSSFGYETILYRDIYGKTRTAKQTIDAYVAKGDSDAGNRYLARPANKKALIWSDVMKSINDDIVVLQRRRMEILKDNTLSNSEKIKYAKEIIRAVNELRRQAVVAYKTDPMDRYQ